MQASAGKPISDMRQNENKNEAESVWLGAQVIIGGNAKFRFEDAKLFQDGNLLVVLSLPDTAVCCSQAHTAAGSDQIFRDHRDNCIDGGTEEAYRISVETTSGCSVKVDSKFVAEATDSVCP